VLGGRARAIPSLPARLEKGLALTASYLESVARTGRTPKMESWRVERFMQALSTLASMRVCCSYAGISTRTLSRWLENGRRDREQRQDDDEPTSIYETFLQQYERVSAESELRALGHIQLAGEKNWTAFAWLLERRRPDDYSRKWLRDGDAPGISAAELGAAIAQAQAEVRRSVPKPTGLGDADT